MIQAKLIALLVALGLASGGALYVKHLRGTVAQQDKLLSAQQETLDGLRADVAERDLNNAALRASRDTVNDRLRNTIAENNAAVDAEVERRKQAAGDAAKAREALRIALDTLSKTSNEDATCAEWLAAPAPACAWDGLRNATE